MDDRLTTKDAITVLRNLQDWLYFSSMNGGTSIQREAIDVAIRALKQPEIIRCKDCKNWDTTWTNDFSPNYHYCPMVDGVRKEDWFCADAEKMDTEEESDD